MVALLTGVMGCGTHFETLAAQTGNAAATTVLDLLLTDFANSVADTFDPYDRPPTDEDDTDGDDGDGDADDGEDADGDGDGDGGGGDGADLYATNCASCHGPDGAGGFAPDITGLTADELSDGVASGTHSSISLTDEDITAIAQFLGG